MPNVIQMSSKRLGEREFEWLDEKWVIKELGVNMIFLITSIKWVKQSTKM